MSENKGLEFQFCSSWSGWDIVDTFALQFYDAVLLPEVAALVGHDKVDVMTVWADSCTVSFFIDGIDIDSGKIRNDFEKSFSFKAQIVVDSE